MLQHSAAIWEFHAKWLSEKAFQFHAVWIKSTLKLIISWMTNSSLILLLNYGHCIDLLYVNSPDYIFKVMNKLKTHNCRHTFSPMTLNLLLKVINIFGNTVEPLMSDHPKCQDYTVGGCLQRSLTSASLDHNFIGSKFCLITIW